MSHVLFLCTGNAARSVIAGALLEASGAGLHVTTAGTHVIEHQPMSRRTRAALDELGLAAERHRSRQVRESDLADADIVVGLERAHIAWIRRLHPEAAAKTATLRRLCRDLPDAPGATLAERISALGLADVELEDWEDVDDPAGGEVDVFLVCARDLRDLVTALTPCLT